MDQWLLSTRWLKEVSVQKKTGTKTEPLVSVGHLEPRIIETLFSLSFQFKKFK